MIHIRPISRLSTHFSVREFNLPQRLLSTSNQFNVRESENFTFDWSKVSNIIFVLLSSSWYWGWELGMELATQELTVYSHGPTTAQYHCPRNINRNGNRNVT